MNPRLLSVSFVLTAAILTQASAATVSPEMMARFKQLPAAQQQALAAQYGVDINSLSTSDDAAAAVVAEPTLQARTVDTSKQSQRQNIAFEQDKLYKHTNFQPSITFDDGISLLLSEIK